MALSPQPEPGLPAPPWEAFHDELETLARGLAAAGDETGAARLRAANAAWWERQREWAEAVAQRMRVHHDINNALVGVSGNAQLLMMGPAGQDPRGRERLEVILRESGRIVHAARVLGELRAHLRADDERAHDDGDGGGRHGGPRG
jgi:signal transduction histidine kinase